MGFHSLGHDVLCGAVASTQNLDEAIELLVAMDTSEAHNNNNCDDDSFRLEEKHWPDLGGNPAAASHVISAAVGTSHATENLAGNRQDTNTSTSAGENSSVAHEQRIVAASTCLKRRRDHNKGFVWVDADQEELGSESVGEDEEWVNLSDMEVESCGDSGEEEDEEDEEEAEAPLMQ